MFINYLDKEIDIENDLGQTVTVKRVQTIDDIYLLSEILSYTENGNFDRISSALGGVGLLHFLDKNFIYPKVNFRKKEEDIKVIEPPKKLSHFKPQNRTNRYFRSR